MSTFPRFLTVLLSGEFAVEGIPLDKPVKADDCPYDLNDERGQIPGIGQGKHNHDSACQIEGRI